MSWQHQFPSKFLIKKKDLNMNEENIYIWLEDVREDAPWKLVDEALRKMAVLSGHEKDQNMYQKMKEMYE
jgi:hypothetical protein